MMKFKIKFTSFMIDYRFQNVENVKLNQTYVRINLHVFCQVHFLEKGLSVVIIKNKIFYILIIVSSFAVFTKIPGVEIRSSQLGSNGT